MHAVAVGAVCESAQTANQGHAIDEVRRPGDTRADRAGRRERGLGDGERTGKVRRVFQGRVRFAFVGVVFVHRVVKKGAPDPNIDSVARVAVFLRRVVEETGVAPKIDVSEDEYVSQYIRDEDS
jgi:hypothetical protein